MSRVVFGIIFTTWVLYGVYILVLIFKWVREQVRGRGDNND